MPALKSENAYTAEEEIRLRRDILEPLEVDYSNVPSWIKQLVKDAIQEGTLPKGKPRATRGSARESFAHAMSEFGGTWVDHTGRMKIDGRVILTSEPYWERVDAHALAQLKRFCEAFRLGYQLSPNSYHYPGRTLLIMVWQTD